MSSRAYTPLSDRDIERVHDTALGLLENVGIGDAIREIQRCALPKGCVQDEDSRLRFPRALVEG